MAPFTRKLRPRPLEAFSELSTEDKASVGAHLGGGVKRYVAEKKEALHSPGAGVTPDRSSPAARKKAPVEADMPKYPRPLSASQESRNSSGDEDLADSRTPQTPNSWDGRTTISKEVRRNLNWQAKRIQQMATNDDNEDLEMPELPTSARHITTFFDRHGLLRQQCPRHWALEACQSHPLHRCYHSSNDRPVGLSRRHQNANAKTTLQVNQMRREANIRHTIERQCIDTHGQMDQQQQRYMRLLFDPVVDFKTIMPEDMLDEAFDISSSSRNGNNKPRDRQKSSTKWNFMRKGTLSLRLCLAAQPSSQKPQHPSQEHRTGETTSAGILTNEQRATLLLIFQRYVLRVSGGGNSNDQMQRSTWFRFLHHCGILGPEAQKLPSALENVPQLARGSVVGVPGAAREPGSRAASLLVPTSKSPSQRVSVVIGAKPTPAELPPPKTPGDVLDTERKGGVSWSHGSSVFALYAESTLGPPTLTFSSWVNAVQHILRGPTFYRTQKEVVANLFGVCLQRCEARISDGGAAPPISGTFVGSFCAPLSLTDSGSPQPGSPRDGTPSPSSLRSLLPYSTAQASESPAKVKAPSKRNADMSREQALRQNDDVGVLGWQSDLAEEQMCEPEVIQLLHEFEAPLQKLFMNYAMREIAAPQNSQGAAAEQAQGSQLKLPGGSGKESGAFSKEDASVAVPAGFSADSVAAAEDDAAAQGLRSDEDSDEEGSSASSEGQDVFAAAEAMDEVQDLSAYKRRRSSILSTAMEPENFHVLLHEFGFLPTIVQTHSARQHVEISLARRNANLLSYESFIECLCRIAFVYLSIFGNSIQQVSPSKAKVVWLITFLRARCRDLRLPDGLGDPRGPTWVKRKHFNLDIAELETLVIWPALNCSVGGSRVKQQMAERGVPRLSMTCL